MDADSTTREAAPIVSLECERLDVYRVAREFDRFLVRILPRRGAAGVRDQLQRASLSVVLNIAEGCGRFARAEKAHFYLIARGSAMECAAALDVLQGRLLIGDADHRQGRELLARIVQMLTRLAVRMQVVR